MALKPDVMVNGNLESWASATDANNWGEIIEGSSSINRDGVDQRSGTFCARLTAANALVFFNNSINFVYLPGKWYRLELWSKITGGITIVPLRMLNATDLLYWKTDGTWGVFDSLADHATGVTGSYTRTTVWFRYDPSFSLSDAFNITFSNGTETGNFFLDDVSIRGPYDHPIVSVTGTIRGPGGIALVGTGVITARLNGVGQVSDGTNNKTITPVPLSFPVVNGVVDMNLIPITNITLEGGGTPKWLIHYNLPGFPKLTEFWSLGLDSPIDITQVPKV